MIGLYGATIGLAILLFLVMGLFIYFVSTGLNKKDTINIDPIPLETTDEDETKD
ncbi:hypothetical protein [Sutcliffiella halmapala]|uniref:hypothetical protein n=1 Tax=Sutcliffiella halmapala TaxID=79882 RepID=UPI0014738971|nr:hypothetical protein [Sutcliffiella halmapala]